MRSDKTALQIASHQGFTAVVELLVQLGANVNLQVGTLAIVTIDLFKLLLWLRC